MSARTLSRLKLISISILILGLVSAAVAFSVHRRSNKLRHAKGFTLITRETNMLFVPRQPQALEPTYAETVRYQKSDGSWKAVRTLYDQAGKIVKKDVTSGIPGEGVFRIDEANQSLDFISSMPSKETTSYVRVDDGHSHPNFLRDDLVQGYQTYVVRFPDQEGGYTDAYLAPELDGKPIRKVTVSTVGVFIEDLVQVEAGDPSEDISLPTFAVNYDTFRRKIANEQRIGKPDIAESMQRQLSEHIAKHRQMP